MHADTSIRFWLDCLAGSNDITITDRARNLTLADWQAIDTHSQRHELTPMLYWQLTKNGAISSVPSKLHNEWQRMYHASAMKNLLRERELRVILKELGREGISPILFKGAVLAFFLYPTPACRPMSDLDMWVSKSDMPRAQVVLERLGYVQRSLESRPLTWQIERDGEIQMFGQNTKQGLVELHWGAFQGEWLHRAAEIDRSGVEGRAHAVTLGTFPARVLEPADALIQIAIALVFCNPLAEAAMKPLLDVFLLAHKISNWEIVVERARQWHVANAMGWALMVSDTLFGLPEAWSAILQLRPRVLRRWLIQPFVNPTSLLAARDVGKMGVRSLFRLVMVDRPQVTMRLVLWAIWPEDAWLKMRYGQSNWHVRVKHVVRSFVRIN